MTSPSSPDEAGEPSRSGHNPVSAPDALTTAVLEVERHVATDGWDAPARLFALVRTARALEADETLASRLPEEVLLAVRSDPEHLLPVEQEGVPAGVDLETLLGTVAFGPMVDGAAVTAEQVTVPPRARTLPDDDPDAVAALLQHPDRQDVRLAVAVLRDGRNRCAIRSRTRDEDTAVGVAPDVAPGVIEALRATLT